MVASYCLSRFKFKGSKFLNVAFMGGLFINVNYIIFPMAKPSIITVILFNFLSFWNEYIISMTLMSSAKGPKTLPVGLTQSDAGTAVGSTVWNYVCRTCNCNASYINYIYMCSG